MHNETLYSETLFDKALESGLEVGIQLRNLELYITKKDEYCVREIFANPYMPPSTICYIVPYDIIHLFKQNLMFGSAEIITYDNGGRIERKEYMNSKISKYTYIFDKMLKGEVFLSCTGTKYRIANINSLMEVQIYSEAMGKWITTDSNILDVLSVGELEPIPKSVPKYQRGDVVIYKDEKIYTILEESLATYSVLTDTGVKYSATCINNNMSATLTEDNIKGRFVLETPK